MQFAIFQPAILNHPVEAFTGWIGNQFFRERNRLLRGEAEAIKNSLTLHISLFDSFTDCYFLFAVQERHFAHLTHVNTDRIIKTIERHLFQLVGFVFVAPAAASVQPVITLVGRDGLRRERVNDVPQIVFFANVSDEFIVPIAARSQTKLNFSRRMPEKNRSRIRRCFPDTV